MRPFCSRRPPITQDAQTTVDHLTYSKAGAYDRARDLPALLPELFWRDGTKAGAGPGVRAALAVALARERRLGARRHRGYSLSRHIALAVAYQAETGASADAAACRTSQPTGRDRGEKM